MDEDLKRVPVAQKINVKRYAPVARGVRPLRFLLSPDGLDPGSVVRRWGGARARARRFRRAPHDPRSAVSRAGGPRRRPAGSWAPAGVPCATLCPGSTHGLSRALDIPADSRRDASPVAGFRRGPFVVALPPFLRSLGILRRSSLQWQERLRDFPGALRRALPIMQCVPVTRCRGGRRLPAARSTGWSERRAPPHRRWRFRPDRERAGLPRGCRLRHAPVRSHGTVVAYPSPREGRCDHAKGDMS